MLLIGEGRRMSGEDDVAMLRTLTADLGRVIEDGGPAPEQLAAAPLLEGWSVSVMPVICQLGTLTSEGRAPELGGPVGGPGTSPLVARAPAQQDGA